MNRSIGFVMLVLGALAPRAVSGASSPIRHLESQAAAVDIVGGGSAEDYARCWFQLATEYRKHGQDAREEAALRKALTVEPRHMDRQLRLASLERASSPERAVSRLRWILDEVQDAATIAQAEHLLADPRLAAPGQSLPRTAPHHDQKLYVVALGDVDPVLLAGIRTRLAQVYGIECASLPAVKVEDPTLRTTLRSRQLDHYMLKAAMELGPKGYQEALAKQGLSPFARLSEDDKDTFVDNYLKGKPDGKRLWGSLSKTDAAQLETTGLIGHLSATFARQLGESNCLGVLAVSSDDLYSGHQRFVFGTNTPTVGVINVSRLLQTDQPRHLMSARLARQGIQTAGYVMPLGECATAGCPRAPASIREDLDTRSDSLCDRCHTALDDLWKRRAGMMTSSVR